MKYSLGFVVGVVYGITVVALIPADIFKRYDERIERQWSSNHAERRHLRCLQDIKKGRVKW